jgi:hypothetical protein
MKLLMVWLGYVPIVGSLAFAIHWLFHAFSPAFVLAIGYMAWS